MATNNPYAKYVAAPQQATAADPIVKPVDPYRQSAEQRAQAGEGRAQADQALQAQTTALQNQLAQLKIDEARKEAEKGQLNPEQKTAIAAEALQKLKLIQSLDKRSKEGWFATGFGAETMADWFPSSTAGNVEVDVGTVAAAGALQRIMEMAQTNGGKNPLTPLSNADFVALGQSISALNPTQGDENFQKNLKTYADIYRRALQAAGGDMSALDEETQAYLATLPAPPPMVGDARQPEPLNPKLGAIGNQLAKRGKSIIEINSFLQAKGMTPLTADQMRAAEVRMAQGLEPFVPESVVKPAAQPAAGGPTVSNW